MSRINSINNLLQSCVLSICKCTKNRFRPVLPPGRSEGSLLPIRFKRRGPRQPSGPPRVLTWLWANGVYYFLPFPVAAMTPCPSNVRRNEALLKLYKRDTASACEHKQAQKHARKAVVSQLPSVHVFAPVYVHMHQQYPACTASIRLHFGARTLHLCVCASRVVVGRQC